MVSKVESASSHECNLEGICRTLGSCLIMWTMLLVGHLWLVMCTIFYIVKCWSYRFMICNLRTSKLNELCGQSLIKRFWNMGSQNPISRDSWLIVHKPIGMQSKLFMVRGTPLLGWLRSIPIYSIGFNHSINTPRNWSDLNYKMSTRFFATSTRMPHPLRMLTVIMF